MHTALVEHRINNRIETALWPGAMTRRIVVGRGATESVGGCFRQCFGDSPAIVVADPNTYAAEGRVVHEQLARAGCNVLEPFVFEDHDLYAEYAYECRLRELLSVCESVAVAVGAGTINDLTKLASCECDRPYMVVATAASMDGYTAFGASITRDGYKQTFPCPAPRAVVVDLDVIAAAPPRLNAAGYADLLAKIPAGADWLVADAAGAEPIDRTAWSLVQDHLREWLADPAAVRRGDPVALAGLIEGLMLTGLGMQRTGTTRPASGAEHQLSHLWDMQHHRFRGAAPMHGQKVGIGSIAMTALYERVLQMTADDIPVDLASVQSRWPAWQEVEAATRRDFPDSLLAEQIIAQQRAKYVPADELLARLRRLKSRWSDLRARLHEQLLPAANVRQMLSDVGAPHHPHHIGITLERLRESLRLAQKIRSRYTVLDLVYEAGWWEQCVDSLFDSGGTWS